MDRMIPDPKEQKQKNTQPEERDVKRDDEDDREPVAEQRPPSDS